MSRSSLLLMGKSSCGRGAISFRGSVLLHATTSTRNKGDRAQTQSATTSCSHQAWGGGPRYETHATLCRSENTALAIAAAAAAERSMCSLTAFNNFMPFVKGFAKQGRKGMQAVHMLVEQHSIELVTRSRSPDQTQCERGALFWLTCKHRGPTGPKERTKCSACLSTYRSRTRSK